MSISCLLSCLFSILVCRAAVIFGITILELVLVDSDWSIFNEKKKAKIFTKHLLFSKIRGKLSGG